MISVIITAYKEPRTIARAVVSISRQISGEDEIIVVAPDDETLNEAKKTRAGNIKLVKDAGKGKPAAMNLAVSKASGNILIFTDGDVYIDENAISNLIYPLRDRKIGAVSGNPVSINPRDDKYGFWAYVLTSVANERRSYAQQNKMRFFCSGYLFAIRKSLFPELNEELLSEDGFISHQIYEQGFGLAYSEDAKVYVQYPDNFKDWIIQKKRSAGGYNQIKQMIGTNIRSFGKESSGVFGLFKFASSFKEFLWLIELFFARIYLWAAVYNDVNLKKKKREELWLRVESTK